MGCLRQSRERYFFASILVSLVLLMLWSNPWKHLKVITNDTTSYYSYLPASLIYHDILELDFVHQDPSRQIWISDNEQGHRWFKMTMGLALLWLPGFLICLLFTNPTSVLYGYDWPFQLSISISCVFYTILGLYFLYSFLRKFIDFKFNALAILGILFGSNLLFYTVVAPGMSHAYNFFLTSALLYVLRNGGKISVPKWLIVGILAGLLVLIRPTNILIVVSLFVLLIFLDVLKFKDLTKPRNLLISLLGAFFVCLPQLLYWKAVSGSFLLYSYQDEGFYFSFLNIVKGVLGFRKGWLVYSPLFLILLVAPFVGSKKERTASIVVLGLTLIFSTVIYSWWCWWYGGGFGSRSMIDFYPLHALTIAVALKRIKNRIALPLYTGAILISLFYTYKANVGALHYDAMSFEAWKKLVVREQIDEEDLIHPDYYGAKYFGTEYHFENTPASYSEANREFLILQEDTVLQKNSALEDTISIAYLNRKEFFQNDSMKLVLSFRKMESDSGFAWLDNTIFYDSRFENEWRIKKVINRAKVQDAGIYKSVKFLYNPRGVVIPYVLTE